MFQQIERTAWTDPSIIFKADGKNTSLFSSDVGNLTCTGISPEGIVTIPHAIRELSSSEILRLDLDEQNSIYQVNGSFYEIGYSARKDGQFALKMGSTRYTREYLGALYAVLLFETFEKSTKRVYVMANHPPKDRQYRDDIYKSIEGHHIIHHNGITKEFDVVQVACYDEPVGGFTYAYLDNSGTGVQMLEIQKGIWLVIDFGGFTTDFTVFRNGRADLQTAGNKSLTFGMWDVLQDFENLVRYNNGELFKSMQFSEVPRWQLAFKNGHYDGGGNGSINCQAEKQVVGRQSVSKIFEFIQNQLQGIGMYNGLLLSGGGNSPSALGKFYTEEFVKQLSVKYVEQNTERLHLMHHSTALGGLKRAKLLISREKLWRKNHVSQSG